MPWTVAFHDDFEPEFLALESAVQKRCWRLQSFLADDGPQLGRPYADTLKNSRHAKHEGAAVRSTESGAFIGS